VTPVTKRRKRKAPKAAPDAPGTIERSDTSADRTYRRACRLAAAGQAERAQALYQELLGSGGLESRLAALIENDLGALAGAAGDFEEGIGRFRAALALDPDLEASRSNLRFCEEQAIKPLPADEPDVPLQPLEPSPERGRATRIAIIGSLFNWPSSGGGSMHTVGVGRSLIEAGYEVRHFYARHEARGIGRVEGEPPLPGEALLFDDAAWNAEAIRSRFREAVEPFAPDYVIVTDSWNLKPHLALAVKGYRYLLRFDGQECLCPLNNCRFLPGPGGGFTHCARHQLATPEECRRCVLERGGQTGQLHRDDRELAGVGTEAYQEVLREALAEAEAVLVNNPLIEAMVSPYASRVCVVPPGVAPGRFPSGTAREKAVGERLVVFMAGVVEEPFKGFDTLHQACAMLWQKRRDFELVVTGRQAGRVDEFTQSVGWLSQDDLPGHYRAADICVVPSWVQEAWAIVATEAMAAGRPVVASRVGGLQFQVVEGATGFLVEPGNAAELADRIEYLLDHPDLRRRMGLAARERFEREYAWPVIIERHYRPLFGDAMASEAESLRAGEVSR